MTATHPGALWRPRFGPARGGVLHSADFNSVNESALRELVVRGAVNSENLICEGLLTNDLTDRKAVQINRIHIGAICNEIGERLRTSPLGKPTALTTDLLDWLTGSTSKVAVPRAECMKDFPNASFPPETIEIMKDAMDAAVSTLPNR
jgi:hypothetical protein